MYTALIVDDELASRETLKNLVKWEKYSFQPPDTAVNGLNALAKCGQQEYNLIFCDIQMPQMDGLEFIKQILKKRPQQKIIIISCHEKFEYAQKALKLGVSDYLIKDLITENELSVILCDFLISNREIKETTGLTNLDNLDFKNAIEFSIKNIPYNTDHTCPKLAVLCVNFDHYQYLDIKIGTRRLAGYIDEFLRQQTTLKDYYITNDKVYILSEIEEIHSILHYYSCVIETAKKIQSFFQSKGVASVSIAISDGFEEIAFIPKALSQVEIAVNARAMLGMNRVILYNSIHAKGFSIEMLKIDNRFKHIREMIYNNNTQFLKHIDELFSLQLPSGFAQNMYYNYIVTQLVMLLIEIASNKGIFAEDADNLMSITHNAAADIGAAKEAIKGHLVSVSLDKTSAYSSLAEAALRYIELEYKNDISLSTVAAALNIHKGYLSRMFKDETGENLVQYITKKKIEHAKYMLKNTSAKLFEISDELSFTNPQYFSMVFKKTTGISPLTYKKKYFD